MIVRASLLFFLALFAENVLSQDRIATLPDGTKVTIRADGTWSAVATPSPTPSKPIRSMKGVIPDNPSDTLAAMARVAAKFEKDEFETERQYLERLALLAKDTRVQTAAGRTLADTVFFFSNVGRYDAESQSFSFYDLTLGLYKMNRRPPWVKFVARQFRSWMSDDDLKVPSIRMPPEKAQQTKSSLNIAVYGLPVAVDNSSVSIVVKRFIVFDMMTGDILAEAEGSFRHLFDQKGSDIILQ